MEVGPAHWVYHRNVGAGDGHGVVTGGLERLPPAIFGQALAVNGRSRRPRCEERFCAPPSAHPRRHDGELQIPLSSSRRRARRPAPRSRRRTRRPPPRSAQGEGIVHTRMEKTARGGVLVEKNKYRDRALERREGGRRRRRRRARRDRRGVAAARRERCARARRAAGRPGGVAAERAGRLRRAATTSRRRSPRDDRPVEVPRRRHRAHPPGEGPRLCAAPEDAQRARGRRGGKGRGGAPKGREARGARRAAARHAAEGARPPPTAAAARGLRRPPRAQRTPRGGRREQQGAAVRERGGPRRVARHLRAAAEAKPPAARGAAALPVWAEAAEDADVDNSVVRAEDEMVDVPAAATVGSRPVCRRSSSRASPRC